LIVSGAATARRVPDLVRLLTPRVPNLHTVLTPNAQQIIAPRELTLIPCHRVIESYFDEAILPRPKDGALLVAPCSFNTLNKLAQGIADSLALSIAAEAIGRGTQVVVAVSVNDPLWAHPRARDSVATLRSWGVDVIDPVADERGYLTLAPIERIADAFVAAAG
jgi:phosphopantothenoylcysteine synthetase/decarboxylase